MRFTVVSTPRSEARLAQLWLRAIDRDGVSIASAQIDRLLRDSPETAGQPQADYYVITQGCLIAEYQFFPDDCLVRILNYELNLS